MLPISFPPIQVLPEQNRDAEIHPRYNIRLRSIPGWLVSMFLHIGILLMLAVWTQGSGSLLGTLSLEFSNSDGESGDFELASTSFAMPEVSATQSAVPEIEDLRVAELTADLETLDGNLGQRSQSLTSVLQAGLETDSDLLSKLNDGLSGLKTGAEFFGVVSEGKRFVFVVDSSNSMRGGRFQDAKKEVIASVKRLSNDQAFYVLFFDNDTARMTFEPDTEPVPGLVAATKENIDKLERWIGTIENEKSTNPLGAMQFAVAMIPDVIYLLSDGQFTDKGKTLEFLQISDSPGESISASNQSKRPKVVIHTIGFYSRDSEITLKQISDAYKGRYRFLPAPNKGSSK